MKSLKSLLYLSLIAVTANVCTFNAYGMKRKRDAQEKVQSSKKQQADTRELALINKKLIPEIFTMIFGYLPQKDLRLITRQVCKAWNDLILNNHPFSLYIKDKDQSEYNNLTKFLQKFKRPISLKINKDPLTQISKNFERLSLGNCKIEDIPDLTPLTNLKKLDLSKNKFIDINAVVSQFSRSLVKLNLAGCNIRKMPDLTSFSNLQKLNLARNNYIHINMLASKLPKSLVKLDLSGYYDTEIPDLISLSNLQVFKFSDHNQLFSIDTLTSKLPQSLARLDLTDCNIIDMPDLTSLHNLKELDLTYNRFLNINTLASHLPTSLKRLNLKFCNITEDQRQALKQALPNVIIKF